MFISFVIFSNLALTGPEVTDTIPEEDIKWAVEYIVEHVEGTTKPIVLPNGYLYEFPDGKYEGFAISKTGSVDWYKEIVPLGGTVLLKPNWHMYSHYNRGLLIHEVCHILDMKTKSGCNCDPYWVHYYYLLSNEWTIEQVKIHFNLATHDPSRSCQLKKKK